MIELLVLDMAGTTIEEGGAVYAALAGTVTAMSGHAVPADVLSAWMGAEKGEALAGMFAALGVDTTEDMLARARDDFSRRLDEAYLETTPEPIPGVADMIAAVRREGVQVALTTGFSTRVAEGILGRVGWDVGSTVDALVTAEQVGAGRPSPKMIQQAMALTGVTRPDHVLVCGDTVRDLEAGRAAGARAIVGVLTGSQSELVLRTGPATHIVASAAELGALVEEVG